MFQQRTKTCTQHTVIRNKYIGIDPSINSTGVVIRTCDEDNKEMSIKYYILKGDIHATTKSGDAKSPLTKRELSAAERYDNFNYVVYDKIPVSDDKIKNEMCKTNSFRSLVAALVNILYKECADADKVHVVMEGISYGSTIRTSSVFDLAGLNYMIRDAVIGLFDYVQGSLVIAPPAHVKKFATGMGNANKELMVATFKSIHPEFDIPKLDDVADAFFMSLLAQTT